MKNKTLKISLTTILLIITIIVIAIMGYIIYEKNIEIKQLSEREEYLKDDEAEIQAKNILDKYVKLSVYENNNIGPMPYILNDLGLETIENIDLLIKDVNNASEYIKSSVKYEEFKNALLQYITEEYFFEKFSQYKNIEGYVGFCNCAGGIMETEVESVRLISKQQNKYIFDVTFKDVELYLLEEEEYLFNVNISFEYLNNKLVISEY